MIGQRGEPRGLVVGVVGEDPGAGGPRAPRRGGVRRAVRGSCSEHIGWGGLFMKAEWRGTLARNPAVGGGEGGGGPG